jgi:HJR/Mrr/RecB family endonuclease
LVVTGIARDKGLFGANFHFDSEYLFDPSVIYIPQNQIHVARFSPSFTLLNRLQRKDRKIDELSWREFETLIAALLERDGYTVQQMKGSKDGGVDGIAVKEMGAAGYFKTLWQAKKKGLKNKVGLSVVRELADTRAEHGASKAIVVTSSYLTRGALERIKRDSFILGKVDRDDLESWITQKLLATRQ